MNNLIFFDKEGNSLNFNYNDTLERYEGDIIFHENSNDTFKTQALYLFEKIGAFEFENPQSLTIARWQLFNEFGFHFYNSNFKDEDITLIEPINTEVSFYSKWINGNNFHKKFPLGSIVRFNSPIFEFNNTDQTYVVVSLRVNSIMIISLVDNKTFDSTYTWSDISNYTNKTISSVDVIGVYDYINSVTLGENLSPWNERDFYDRLYKNKKLNIVNSLYNDTYSKNKKYIDAAVVTVKNENLIDIVHHEYITGVLPVGTDIWIEVILKTDLPLIYQGAMTFYDDTTQLNIGGSLISNVLSFSDPIPGILKPGIIFKVVNSVSNSQFLQIDSIPRFLGNSNLNFYATGSQVLWNNQIYQCSQSYTWSSTSSVTPDDSIYWSSPTYLPIIETSSYEALMTGYLYLTTDHLYFTQSYTQSSSVTLASAVEKYSKDLKSLNIDMYYQDHEIHSDLIYPSMYAVVNYYGITSSFSPTSSLNSGVQKVVYERAIEIDETLDKEFNYDYSENFSYNLVFTDIDDYGLIIKINKMVYQSDVQFIYSSGVVDMERTIHVTLGNWMTENSITLLSLGIISSLQIIGGGTYFNSINIKTEYPNVPIEFRVEVGTTANFHIEKSQLRFFEPSIQGSTFSLGQYIDIVINNKSYGITHSLPNPTTTINQTLQNWVEEYADILDNYGIYVENQASVINFNVKSQSQRCDIEVRAGKSVLPGDNNYKIINKMKGNHGTLLTSNEILLGTFSSGTSSNQSFESGGFATGMVTGINGTVYPLQDVEYNVLFLDPGVINLSYEGPFWGLTGSVCSSSPFTIVAFTIGFTQSSCDVGITFSGGGMFDVDQFSSNFSINSNSTTYSVFNYPGFDSMTDLVYVQPTNTIFVLGETATDDDVLILDSIDGSMISTISLPSNSNSLQIIFNYVDNYVWVLSEGYLWQIDPYSNTLVNTIVLSSVGFSLDFNRINGDVYVSTDTSIEIFNSGSLITSISTIPYSGSYYLSFNDFEGDMYVSTRDGSTLLRIDGSTRVIQTTYTIPGLLMSTLSYDSITESIYLWGTYLFKVGGGLVTSITLVTSGSFNDVIFNSQKSGLNISTDIPEFSLLSDSTDTYIFSNSLSGVWGYQSLNLYDGGVYLSSQNPTSPGIWTLSNSTGVINHSVTLPVANPTTKIIFNPDRNSAWAIQPSLNNIVEVVPVLSYRFTPVSPTYSSVTQSSYGSLSNDYIQRDYLWLHTKDYIREPRSNFSGDPRASLYWKWFSDNVSEFFFYDFSGDYLPTSGVLAYTGVKPLDVAHLNRKANRDLDKVSNPEYQQTIFTVIEKSLSYIDDDNNISTVPQPMELFIGFNSQLEGGLRSILQLYKKETIDFTISTLGDNTNIITFETIIDASGDRYGLITLDTNSTSNFLSDSDGVSRGFKPGQQLAIFIKDETNKRKQYISNNNGYLVKIREVYFKSIKVDFFKSIDSFDTESTKILNYPKTNVTTYLSVRFKIWDKEIGRFNVFGQTEIEDIRFETELGNVGKLISSDDVYIFKEYDIKEEGIDWTFLNKKRKEMLMMRSLIYPYIGSYKSIINAINHFGYNDLELNEYYRNININSPNYLQLFKVEIPDIFDNTVEGWKDNDFIKHTFPNQNYEDTNLFNLTYRITDREGNNILTYTLEEVQTKLQGLKYWLQKNIIPITRKILDITGRADFVSENTISHIVRDVNIIKFYENFTPVSFKLNELYLMPVNNGSTVYNCVLDFYFNDSNNSPYPGITSSSIPDNYSIDITTYEIYREWYAFKNYMTSERVTYYDRLYESVIDNNKTNDPRKYQGVQEWVYGTTYNISDMVKYDNYFYIFSGYGYGFTSSTDIYGSYTASATSSIITPFLDNINWLDVTEWKEISLKPIQHISDVRRISNLNTFNFTIDSNIDPYLVIEVSSNNGYGATYRDKKNYEIKGILDVRELESFTNLTSKQYYNSVLPTVYISN